MHAPSTFSAFARPSMMSAEATELKELKRLKVPTRQKGRRDLLKTPVTVVQLKAPAESDDSYGSSEDPSDDPLSRQQSYRILPSDVGVQRRARPTVESITEADDALRKMNTLARIDPAMLASASNVKAVHPV